MKRVKSILAIAALLVVGAAVRAAGPEWPDSPKVSVNSNAAAETDPQKTAGPPAAAPNSTPYVSAEEYTKNLLLLMDTDKNGKVSKKEFMAFMSAEFDRLDVNHDGSLDVKELAAIRVRPYVGK